MNARRERHYRPEEVHTIGRPETTGFNIGGIYDLSEHYHLHFSGGMGLENAALTNQFSCYLAIQSTF